MTEQTITHELTKDSQPDIKTDKHLGKWGAPYHYYTLPGGALLQIDLSRLTLGDYRSMKENYYISLCLNLIKFHFYQTEWHIECPGSPEMGKVIEELMRGMWTRLSRTIARAFWAGYSPNAKVWEIDPYSKYKTIGKFRDLGPEGCSVYVGDSEAEKDANEFKGIRQGTEIIPPEYAFWYAMFVENGDWMGAKFLKPAFGPWFMSQIIHLFTNRYYERFGSPIPVGHAPFDEKVTDTNGDEKQGATVMLDIAEKLRNHTVVVLPTDRDAEGNYKYDIKYLESQMRGVEFDRYLDRLDREMALALLTPQLLFESGNAGSYNLGTEHKKTFLMLQNGIIGDIKDYLDRYIIRPLAVFNYGLDAPKAEFKYNLWGKISDELIQTILQALIQSGQAGPDLKQLSEVLQMDINKIEQPVQPVPPANQPPVVGKPEPPVKATHLSSWEPPRPLTPREQMMDFPAIISAFSKADTTLKAELTSTVSRMATRVGDQVSRAYDKDNSLAAYQDIKLGYQTKFKAAWLLVMSDLYEQGRSAVASEQSFVPIPTTSMQRKELAHRAGLIADKQMADLTFAFQSALAKANEQQKTREQVLAAVALAFAAFLADGSSLDLSIQWATTWAMNRGRLDYATDTKKAVYGFEWSAILDGNECAFCHFMDSKVVASSSPYYGNLIPPAHFNCRCLAIPIFEPLSSSENLLTSIPEDIMAIAGMLTLLGKGKD